MIIKGQARARSRQLADHLLRRDQNEDIRLYELRGVVATDVRGALAEMEALTAAVHSKRPLYHASISPEAHRPLSDDQIRIAADTLERTLGLSGQPRVIVIHRKQGREHLHAVWSRIDVERQRIISDSWSYRAHEQAARELEAAFGHRTVRGVHVPESLAPRPRRARKDYEYRQAERSGTSPEQVSAELTAIWQSAPGIAAFRDRLAQEGYVLARGDRRVFVVVDCAGNVHSLARRLGMSSRELAEQLRGLPLEALPSVAEIRKAKPLACRAAHSARFSAAATEAVAASSRPPRAMRKIPPPRAVAIRAAIRWINEPRHAPGDIMRPIAQRFVRTRRTLALRADILASFAAKIDAAYGQHEGEALLAVLARLADERETALRTLERLDTDGIALRRQHRRGRAYPLRRRRRRLTQRRSKP